MVGLEAQKGQGKYMPAVPKGDALKSVSALPPQVQKGAKSFFKGSSNRYNKYEIQKDSSGNFIINASRRVAMKSCGCWDARAFAMALTSGISGTKDWIILSGQNWEQNGDKVLRQKSKIEKKTSSKRVNPFKWKFS